MTDDQTKPVPPPPEEGGWGTRGQQPATAEGEHRRWYEKKRILLPLVALIAFGLGAAGGGTATETPQQDSTGIQPADTDGDGGDGRAADGEELAAALEALEEERDTWRSRSEEQQAEIERLRAELAEAEGEAPPESEPEPTPAEEQAGGDGTYTAGAYEFADVQVNEDFAGDFEMRTRMTNTGPDRESVGVTATLFSGGTVVATLQGVVNSVSSGQTVTLQLISTDDYRDDWDEVEFQVEYEF